MSELARSVGLLATQRGVLLVLGAARTKIAATLLGPSGMGVLAQALALRELLVTVSYLGTRSGYLKLVAEHHGQGDTAGLERLIVTAITLVTVLAAVISGAAALAAADVADWAFGDSTDALLVSLVSLTVAVGVPAKLLTRTFAGVLDYRTFLLIAVVESVTAIVAMAWLAYAFGVAGAVASFAVLEAVALVCAGYLVWKRIAQPRGMSLGVSRLDPALARRLLRLAGALAVTSALSAAAAVFVRGEVLRQLGSEANGYYQVAWQVGQNYLGLLGTALWSYGMPKAATRLQDPESIGRLQNSFLRIVLSILAPGVVLLLVSRDLWIPLLFSDAFLAASGVVAWQLAGELIAMTRQSMNISLLPRERLRFLIVQASLYWGTWSLLSWLSLAPFGPAGAAVAYFGANVITLGVTYGYHHLVLAYRVDRDNRILLAWMIPATMIGALAAAQPDVWVGRVLPLSIAFGCLWWNRDVLARLRAQEL